MLTILLIHIVMRALDQKRSISSLQLPNWELFAWWNIIKCHIYWTFRAKNSNVCHCPLLIEGQSSSFRGFVKGFFELKTHVFGTAKKKPVSIECSQFSFKKSCKVFQWFLRFYNMQHISQLIWGLILACTQTHLSIKQESSYPLVHIILKTHLE